MIYFVRRANDGAIKIGTTIRLSVRLGQLRKAFGECELLAVMPGSYADESALHQQFAYLVVQGREWFAPDPSLLAFIEAEGAAWDGKDEVPLGRLVRMDDELCEKARMLAAFRKTSMAEMFTEVLRPIIKREYEKELARETKRIKGENQE